MYGSAPSAGPVPSPARDAARNQRYTYLVGRLHARQITMEEATELFNLMQSMLQSSEAARAALVRAVPPPPVAGVPGAVPRVAAGPAGPSAGDDLLLVGLLAMGAGAGLLAAMTKRIQDATPPAAPASNSRPNPVASTRKG